MVNLKSCIKQIYFINNQINKINKRKEEEEAIKKSKEYNKIADNITYFGVDYVVSNLKSDKIKR